MNKAGRGWIKGFGGVAVVAAIVLAIRLTQAAEDGKWTVAGCDRMDIAVLVGGTPAFILENNVTGPDWKGARLLSFAESKDGKTRRYRQEKIGFYVNWFDKKPMEGLFDLDYALRKTGDRTFEAKYAIRPEFDTQLGFPKKRGEKSISIGPVLKPTPWFKGGTAVVTSGGAASEMPLPPPRGSVTNVTAVELQAASGETVKLGFEPPVVLHLDHGEMRIWASGEAKAGGEFAHTVRLELPRAAGFEAANRLADTSGWIPLDFEKAGDFRPGSALGMEGWLERPAGGHGWLGMRGKDFVFEDGTPAKFWGINICGPHAAPAREEADRWADRCAKHGVNYVRFHKILNHMGNGWALDDKEDGTKLNEERAALFDYFSAALAKRGVYYGWSQYYAYKLSPADKDRVLAYDELMAKGEQWFKGTTIMLVNFAPDLQELHIKTLLNLLTRTNTVTGTRYADDRALAYIEVQNEDDIFFHGLDNQVKACPSYYALMKRQFSDWLRGKYGSEDKWKAAWGGKVGTGETWAAGSVDPFADYLYDPAKFTPRVLDVYGYL